jgi:hypothetical protein
MRYSKGVCWISDCRIPFVDEKVPRLNVSYEHKTNNNFGGGNDNRHGTSTQSICEGQGRFTPNLLVCDDMLNDGNVVQYNKTRVDNGSYLGGHREEFVGTDNNPIVNKVKGQFFSDKGTNSRYYDLDKWFDNILEKL